MVLLTVTSGNSSPKMSVLQVVKWYIRLQVQLVELDVNSTYIIAEATVQKQKK